MKSVWVSSVLLAGLASLAAGGYNESGSGDLSNIGTSPTLISLSVGSNQILGSTGKGTDTVVDRDYFTFTLAAGERLKSIMVLDNTTVGGNFGFIGIESGSQLTLATNASSAAGLLGWRHYSGSDINNDILPFMASPANGSSGFTPPLPSGSYAVWVQDTTSGTFNYGFDFIVEAPEPGTCGAAAVLLAMVVVQWRRKYSGAPRSGQPAMND